MIDKFSLLFNKSKFEWIPTEISNEIVYVKNTMTPFTGKLNRYKNEYSGKFINGKKIGIHKEYNHHGTLIYEGEYFEGDPVGLHRKWSEYGNQLLVEVNFKDGKRHGLNKIWDKNGNLIKLDFGDNEIKQYIKDYFNSSSNLDIIEGNYSVEDRSKETYEKRGPNYEFSIIKIHDKFYAVMTKPFKNNYGTNSKLFSIGEIKAIGAKVEENYLHTSLYTFDWFLADKSIELNKSCIYDIESKTLHFDDMPVYYKNKF